MKRRNLALTTLSAVALSLLSCVANAQPKEKVSLMLNWYLYSEHAPFFLGKEKGFFDAEGIDLDIQEGRGLAFPQFCRHSSQATAISRLFNSRGLSCLRYRLALDG